MAHVNRVVMARVFGPLAGRVPPFAVVEHVGRRSGRRYRTVIWAFPVADGMAVALTFGSSADWVRNVVAAGECRLKWRARWRRYDRPEVVAGWPGLGLLPAPLRPVLWLLISREVLRLRPVDADGAVRA